MRFLAPALVVAVCAAATAPYWFDQPRWSPDSLFYEARVLELRGAPTKTAVDHVFFGKIGVEFRRSNGIAESVPALTNDRAWISYTHELYKRRQVVPILAAAAYPVFGDRSLSVVSLLGYFVAGLLLYVLIGLRFSVGVSLAVSCLFVLLEPMRDFALYPLTDSWGVAAIAMTMIAALGVFDRGLRWLPWWMLSVALLSVTRDAVVIVVGAALIAALLKHDRVSSVLALSGVVAMLPSMIIFPLPIRQFLAYGLNGNRVPSNDGWRFIAAHYWPNLDGMLREYWATMAAGGLLTAAVLIVLSAAALLQPAAIANRSVTRIAVTVALAFVALVTASTGVGGSPLLGQRLPAVLVLLGGAAVIAVWPRTDVAADYIRASAGTALVFIAIFPQARGLRTELVLVPFAALGVALTVQRLRWLLATAVRPAERRVEVSRTSSPGLPT